MEKFKLMLIGGFLGSGKTTAIYGAVQLLQSTGVRIGVITNDQGIYQVDERFLNGLGINSRAVNGGCFCCKFNELESKIADLREKSSPEIIFLESVGSCVDLAATVINPFLFRHPHSYDIVLSVFADIRLLTRFLSEERVFHDSVNYIYHKQLEEADIIIANKADLILPAERRKACKIICDAMPGKRILFQDSRSVHDLEKWLNNCDRYEGNQMRNVLELDYELYGKGEAELAWLDEEIGIVSNNKTAVDAANKLMNSIYTTLTRQKLLIGHLKFLIDNGTDQIKVSFHQGGEERICERETIGESERIVTLINARVQTDPQKLQTIVANAIIETEKATDCKILERGSSAFKPGKPVPTYRINPSA